MGSIEQTFFSSSEFASKPPVLRIEDVEHIFPERELLKELTSLMTPKEILSLQEFEHPHTIHPLAYPNFETLLEDREAIRTLRLVPAKTQEEYERYHSFSMEALLDQVKDTIGQSALAFALNQFPYYMPEDTNQFIAWVHDASVTDEKIVHFIGQIATMMNKNENDLILFERPLGTTAKYVKGTIPAYRHIHVWMKK